MGFTALAESSSGFTPVAAAASFDTALTPSEERQFESWKARYAPKDSGVDYDLRGAFKAGLTPDAKTGHWPDTFKKPNHPTFSVESQYAKDAPELAGRWQGETYVPPKSGGFTPAPKAAPTINAADALPETLNFAGMDTGIPINPELSAYLVSMGGRMSGSYRGAKQLLGLDSGQEAGNERNLRLLSEDPQVGGYATAGGVIGSGFDPATYVLPMAKAKSVIDLAKYGAASGSVTGFLNPVEDGGSRAVNAAVGAAAGGVAVPVLGAAANRLAGAPRLPWRSQAEISAPPVNVTPTLAPGGAAQASSHDLTADAARMWRDQGGSTRSAADMPMRELVAGRREMGMGGNVDMRLAAQLAGGTTGAAAGALTADEGAPPQEIAARALIGGFAGWQLAKLGTKIGGVKPGTSQPSVLAAHEGGKPIEVVGDVAEPLFTKEVSPHVTKQIAGLAREFFAENPGMRDPTRLISDDIQRYVAGGAVTPEMLAAHGLDEKQFAGIWRASITDHAKALGYLSQVMRTAQQGMTPEEVAAFKAAGGVAEDAAYVRPFWKKLTDTWRGLLVTQPVTAVRNAITQVGRVGLDVMQAPIDSWVQQLTGRPHTVHAMDGFEELLSMFGRNKANTEKILSAFPKEKDRLFQSYLSDVASGTDVGSKTWHAIETGVQAANVLNRTQEFIIRRGIFQTALSHNLRNEGKDLVDIIKRNAIGEIPEDAVKNAVSTSLNKTFAETPAWGTMSRKLIDAVNAIPGANLAIPFPRFMYNAIKFQYEYSPLGVLSYLSDAERKSFAAGNVEKVSKAIIGSAMFGAAMLFRNSDHAGEKWYEAVNSKGETIDLRPFNPFASYLFAADVLKKSRDGTLYKLNGSDIAQGLLSTNMRAGTGLYLLDNAIGLMTKTADEEKLSTKGKELAGDFLSGFFTPMNIFRDAYDQITEGQSVLKDTRQDPIWGPIKARFPIASQSLPDAEFPTREGPKTYSNPLLRQATGLTVSDPKNALEKELDRLGFDRREILPSSGDREVDTQYSKAMGAVAEKVLVPLVETEKFKALSDATKGAVLHEAMSEVRHEVHQAVNEGLPPEKQMKLEIKKQPARLRILLEEFTGIKSGGK